MRAINDIKIVVKLAVSFGFLALLTLIVSVLGYTRLSSVETTNAWSEHTHQVLDTVHDITTAMVNQETGLRGYLVANDPKFLEPYRAGQATYKRAFDAIKTLTADNAAQQARLVDLSRFVDGLSLIHI